MDTIISLSTTRFARCTTDAIKSILTEASAAIAGASLPRSDSLLDILQEQLGTRLAAMLGEVGLNDVLGALPVDSEARVVFTCDSRVMQYDRITTIYLDLRTDVSDREDTEKLRVVRLVMDYKTSSGRWMAHRPLRYRLRTGDSGENCSDSDRTRATANDDQEISDDDKGQRDGRTSPETPARTNRVHVAIGPSAVSRTGTSPLSIALDRNLSEFVTSRRRAEHASLILMHPRGDALPEGRRATDDTNLAKTAVINKMLKRLDDQVDSDDGDDEDGEEEDEG